MIYEILLFVPLNFVFKSPQGGLIAQNSRRIGGLRYAPTFRMTIKDLSSVFRIIVYV
jgi:hypothetical protein